MGMEEASVPALPVSPITPIARFYNNLYIVALLWHRQQTLSVNLMQRPLAAVLVTFWLVAGSFPLLLPGGSGGPASAPPKYGDESFGRFEWVHPFPTGNGLAAVAWSPDNSMALVAGSSGTLLSYDGFSFTTIYTGATISFTGIAWHPTAEYALITGSGGTLLKYRAGALSELQTGTTVNLAAISINPNTGLGLAVGAERTVLLIDGETVRTVSSGGNVALTTVSWEPGGTYALAAGAQSTGGPGPQRPGVILQYWPENNTIKGVFSQNYYSFAGSAFSPNSETAYLSARYMDNQNGIFEGRLFLWNDTGLTLAASGLPFNLNGVCWDPGGATAYVLAGNSVLAYDLEGAEAGGPYPVQGAGAVAMSWRPDAGSALIVGAGGAVASFDGQAVYTLSSSLGATTFNAVAWSPDGSRCLAVGTNGAVITYDGKRASGQVVRVKGVLRSLNGVAWHPDGNFALVVGDTGTIVQYNKDGTLDNNIQSGTVQNLRAVAWAPNGSYAVIVGDSGTIRRYTDLVSTAVPSVTEYTLRAVAFRPNDSMAMIVGGDVRSVQGPTGRVSTSWQVVLQYNGRIVTPNRIIQQGPVFNSINYSPAIIAADGGNYVVIGDFGAYNHRNLSSGANLLAGAWLRNRQDALLLGDGGTAALFNHSRSESRLLAPPATQPFTAVSMRPQGDYALCVGWNGMMMKYLPNAPPAAVVLNAPASVTDNSMELRWTGNADRDFNRLEVFQSIAKDFTGAKTILNTTDQSSVFLLAKGLTRLTTYNFKVRVHDNAGLWSDSNAVSATTLLGNIAPAASVLSAPASVTDSSMRLDWTQNRDGDFARYELHKGSAKNFVPSSNTLYSSMTDQTKTSETVVNLAPSTTYYFRLRTVDTGSLQNDSNEVSAATLAVNLPPTAVILSAPSEVGDTALKLGWSRNNESDFDSYEVHQGGRPGFNLSGETLVTTIFNQSTATFTVEGLVNNTTYFFRVRVQDTGGLYNDSNEVNATTTPPNAPPAAVTLFEALEVGETTVELAWSQNGDRDFRQYEVAGSDTPGFPVTQDTILKTLVEKGQNTTEITGLAPDTAYYFKVRVRDTSGLVADSNEIGVVTRPNQAPEAVALYGPDNVTVGTMDIEWSESPAPDFARYEVFRSTFGNFTPTPAMLIAQVNDRLAVVYRATGLQPSTTYFFKLRIVDIGGLFNDSNEVTDTTRGPDLPPAAVVLADPPEQITETSVLLEWSKNSDPDFARYIVHRSTTRGFNPQPATEVRNITDPAQLRYNVTGLKPNTQYYFKVAVQDAAGQTNNSNEVRARTWAVDVPPTADAGGDRTVTVGKIMALAGSGFDTDGWVVLYEWDFETDGAWDSATTNGNVTHIYQAVGLYTATLRVTDERGMTGTDTANITVEPPVPPNVPPVIIDAGEPVLAYIGEEVFFAGNATDPDGYITLYQWDFLGDGLFEYSSPDGANTTFFYDTAGAYTALLRVSDDRGGTASLERQIEIVRFNNAPVARIDSPQNARKYFTDEVVTLSAASSYDPDGDRLTYNWENTRDMKKLASGVTTRLTLARGEYSIRLTVSDGSLSSEASVNISVLDRPNVRPSVKIEAPLNNTFVKGTVTVSGTAKDDKKVSYVEIRIDPTGKWQKATGTRYWSFEIDTKPLALSKHTVYVRAFDGTDYSDEANIAFTVSNPAPEPAKAKGFIPGFETAAALAAAALAMGAAGITRRTGGTADERSSSRPRRPARGRSSTEREA
jgi:chitodextrinase/sugar lactone lactonase YvrE